MGIFGSSEENNSVEQKTIDANGNVNNNIIIREANDTHQQMLLNEKLVIATYLLVAAEIIKLGIHFFQTFGRSMKKKYQNRNNDNNNQ